MAKAMCPRCGVNPRTTPRSHCEQCRRDQKRKENQLHKTKYRYGITMAERNALLMAQAFKCAACGERLVADKPLEMAIDHCHTSGKVRAILCFPCNLALGAAKENPTRLRLLASYIERYSKKDQ